MVDKDDGRTREQHSQELRRGTVVLAALLVLRTPGYGYALLEQLGAAGLDVEGNTLYPLLRRLEGQGLLTSEWNTDEPRPRKFYGTSPDGEELARRMLAEWRGLSEALTRLDESAPAKTAPAKTAPLKTAPAKTAPLKTASMEDAQGEDR